MKKHLQASCLVFFAFISVGRADDQRAPLADDCLTTGEAGDGIRMPLPVTAANVATAGKPGVYALPADRWIANPEALQVTVKPVAVNPDESFLVRVFVADGCQPTENDYVGTFSFFPGPFKGEIETFTLPAFSLAGKLSRQNPGKELKVGIQLISGHPQSPLKDTALEVIDARLK